MVPGLPYFIFGHSHLVVQLLLAFFRQQLFAVVQTASRLLTALINAGHIV
jgi:hypothetical protein